jgi:hypothetical protein
MSKFKGIPKLKFQMGDLENQYLEILPFEIYLKFGFWYLAFFV